MRWLLLVASCNHLLLSPDLAPQCGPQHTRVTTALASLEPLDGPIRAGMTLRVKAGVPVRGGCDVFSDITVAGVNMNVISGGTVTLTAHIWQGAEGCGPVQLVPRVVALDTRFAPAHVTLQ